MKDVEGGIIGIITRRQLEAQAGVTRRLSRDSVFCFSRQSFCRNYFANSSYSFLVFPYSENANVGASLEFQA